MAGARIIFPDFREEQSDSRYPFADTATLTDLTNTLEIPRDAFIDAVIHGIGSDLNAHIARVVVDNNLIEIVIANRTNQVLATGRYSPLAPPENGRVALYDTYDRPAGLLLLSANGLALFGGWEVGSHTFAPSSTEFVSTTVIPAQENCVRAITNAADQFFTGDVWLIGGNGVVVRQVADSSVIRVDIVGEPLFKRILCGTDEAPFEPPNVLKTINGCGPDDFGNFTFTVTNRGVAGQAGYVPDPVLRISPRGDSLQISIVGTGVL